MKAEHSKTSGHFGGFARSLTSEPRNWWCAEASPNIQLFKKKRKERSYHDRLTLKVGGTVEVFFKI